MKPSESVRVRKLIVRTLDRLFFEPGNRKRNHISCYRRFVQPMFGICRSTFYSYLRTREDDLSDLELEPYIETGLRAMVNALLTRPKWW